MSTFIKGATMLAMGGAAGAEPFAGDLLIEADRIAAIGSSLQPPPGAEVIDGSGKLVMPGLVNAHLHTNEALFKGRYDNMPLEVWMLYSYPIRAAKRLSSRLVYLRSMLVAMESLKYGVTCITDDLYESPRSEMELMDSVIDAYVDCGIRATVSAHVVNRNFLDTIPFTREYVPHHLQQEIDGIIPMTTADYIAYVKQVHGRFHGRAGRIRTMLAPSAPQRCTVDLMLAANDLAREWGVPFHTHIVETKVQGVTGPEFHGKSLTAYMDDLGLLNPWTTIAHSIWVNDDDIERLGRAGVSVAHNAISNQKLGAGSAPVRKLLTAGVNIGLGSDGICSNDTPRIFDVMKAAGLMHKVNNPDWSRWLTASEVLYAGTIGGARTALLQDEIGSLEPGKKADLLILDMQTANFTPLNDVRNHLVYCEEGSSIEKVFVNGEMVVENGKLTKVDEKALLAELRAMMPEFIEYTGGVEAANHELEPAFTKVIQRCYGMDIGINRWASDA
ncbi:amidohydrolase [Mesorhizobium sp.]|uniref:amidohydrolase family protein n=1 Tax=Mesorhizobium sp. TaxID=1871066 RepID=UPI000FE929B0|nr:amidohydrolase [Mesorhizobium sp.]RWC61825.1 MAG: amidohydrolase [Mesorhizobium sp.]RWC66396.1 MAG: amidohydrolase [Mesorhizobium sp.]